MIELFQRHFIGHHGEHFLQQLGATFRRRRESLLRIPATDAILNAAKP